MVAMKEFLKDLKRKIADYQELPAISEDEIKVFVENTTIVLSVGGKGQRMADITQNKVNKNALVINDQGLTIVERTILMYKNAGFKNFLGLVYTQSDSIMEILGDGSALGVSITYSHDPGKPIGRGGAILNAMENNKIDLKKSFIVHNPCDQIIDETDFLKNCISAHCAYVKQGALSTVIVTNQTPYTFSGMSIQSGFVKDIEYAPMIPVPAHIGVTFFDAAIFPYFDEHFNLEEKADFESVLFPLLAKEQKMGAYPIAYENWVAVKDRKSYNRLKSELS